MRLEGFFSLGDSFVDLGTHAGLGIDDVVNTHDRHDLAHAAFEFHEPTPCLATFQSYKKDQTQ